MGAQHLSQAGRKRDARLPVENAGQRGGISHPVRLRQLRDLGRREHRRVAQAACRRRVDCPGPAQCPARYGDTPHTTVQLRRCLGDDLVPVMAAGRAVVELVDAGCATALRHPDTNGLGQIPDVQHGETGVRASGCHGQAAAHRGKQRRDFGVAGAIDRRRAQHKTPRRRGTFQQALHGPLGQRVVRDIRRSCGQRRDGEHRQASTLGCRKDSRAAHHVDPLEIGVIDSACGTGHVDDGRRPRA